MMVRTALIVLFLSVSFPAYALQIPKASDGDPRIKTVEYKPNDVVRINSFIGIGTLVKFSRGEQIISKALGYSAGWAFEDRRDSFFIKPKVEHGDTNLMVQTNKRTYDFELISFPEWKKTASTRLPQDSRMCFRLQFIYPEDDLTGFNKVASQFEKKNRLNKTGAARNWNYTMSVYKKSREIVPSMCWDNGTFTYLTFPKNRNIPAIFQVSEDGVESLINTHVVDDVVVIHRVCKKLYLRVGNQVVGIYNESYDSDGVPAKDGMTVPGLKRTIRGDTDGQL